MDQIELKDELLEAIINFNKLPINFDEVPKLSKLENSLLFIIDSANKENEMADNAYINKHMVISKVSLSRSINNLRRKGYISIKKNPNEFRKNYYELKPKGKETCSIIRSYADRMMTFVVSSIGEDDAKNFIRILTKLFTSLELVQHKEGDKKCLN